MTKDEVANPATTSPDDPIIVPGTIQDETGNRQMSEDERAPWSLWDPFIPDAF